jgi:hypothetical protein
MIAPALPGGKGYAVGRGRPPGGGAFFFLPPFTPLKG